MTVHTEGHANKAVRLALMKHWFPFLYVGLLRVSVAAVEEAGLSRRRRWIWTAVASSSTSPFLFAPAFDVRLSSELLWWDDAELGAGVASGRVGSGVGLAGSE